MNKSLTFILHPSAFILPLDLPPTPSVILVLNKQGLDSFVVGAPKFYVPPNRFHFRARAERESEFR
jgi:hypothetical protein